MSALSETAHARPRGFIYFCEESLRYSRGLRAWLFFGPYLAGAVALEPLFRGLPDGRPAEGLFLLAYLLLYPSIWRTVLRRAGLERRQAGVGAAGGASARAQRRFYMICGPANNEDGPAPRTEAASRCRSGVVRGSGRRARGDLK